MTPPINIDGTQITGASIDGSDVREITVDGTEVFFSTDTVVLPESGDISNHFTGNTGSFSIDNTSPNIVQNDLSVKVDISSNADNIISQSGLNRYPAAGEQISTYCIDDSSEVQASFMFGVQNSSNFYAAGIEPSKNNIVLRKNSHNTAVASGSATLSSNTWFEVEIDWQTDNSIDGRVFEVDQSTGARQTQLGSFAHTDSEYTSGGVGFIGNSTKGRAAFDHYRVTDVF